jgi:hypothetical protein
MQTAGVWCQYGFVAGSLAMRTAIGAGAQLLCSRQPHEVLSPFD